MSSAPPSSPSLTPSSAFALDWAGAAALLRSGLPPGSVTPTVEMHVTDLFVGVAVAHAPPEENALQTLLNHFGIRLGAVIAGVYRPPLGVEALAAARARMSQGGAQPDPATAQVLDSAASSDVLTSDGRVPLNGLVVALLQGTHPVAARIRALMSRQGVDGETVARSMLEYARMPQRPPLEDFLKERHPWPPELRVAPYGSDVPGERRTDDGASGHPDDLLEIGAEVDALAYLICSTNLAPPLAVGLFGDWGSGKSYFMRALQRRIDGITENLRAGDQHQADLPFYRSVVQIEFNAWHYVEGNLWASLVEHIFQNLREHADEDAAEVRRRRDEILVKIKAYERSGEAARQQIETLETKVDEAASELERRRTEEAQALEELDRLKGDLTASPELLKGANQALADAGAGRAGETIGETVAAVRDARDALVHGWGVLRLLRAGGRPAWKLLALALATIAVLPLASWALDAAGAASVTNALASIGATLATAVAALRAGTGVVNRVAGRLAAIQTAAEEEDQRLRDELSGRVEEAEERLRHSRQELERARAEVDEAKQKLKDLTRDLASVPTRVFADFLDERLVSQDYRSHLGVPALIRRDFERLSRLIQSFNRRMRDKDSTPVEGDEHLMNRIVLYIDDLDRCSARRVVQVLEAVHLLLAFPLFVVVVAVDSRWLAGSLRRSYGALFEGVEGPGTVGDSWAGTRQARPDDYLEKIFQVPFRVQSLGDEGRRRMVHGVLEGALATDEGATGTDADPAAPAVGRLDAALVDELGVDDTERASSIAAEALTITRAELDAMDHVAPLLGTTPRAIKRFTNVYLLIKSIARHSGRDVAGHHGQVILLLAIATGQPALASPLFQQIEVPGPDVTTLAQAVEASCPGSVVERWLGSEPVMAATPLDALRPWVRDVARFTFADHLAAPSPRPAQLPR